MAVEDKRFYNHFGIDIIGLIRAMYANYRAHRVVQGGSTLTQQLAKTFCLLKVYLISMIDLIEGKSKKFC